MAVTHYIEVDEEIISTVSRLRKTADSDIVFVFPKHALILQSIVSLRLLQREAHKLGKRISVMTQDEEGRLLAERAGFETRDLADGAIPMSDAQATSRFSVPPGETLPLPVQSAPLSLERPHSTAVGSDEFFGKPFSSQPSILPPPLASNPTPLRIRNASPAPQTSLNSMRPDGPLLRPQGVSAQTPRIPREGLAPNQDRPPSPTLPQPKSGDRSKRLEHFFGGRTPSSFPSAAPAAMVPGQSRESQSTSVSQTSRTTPIFFGAIGVVSALILVGGIFFFFLPKTKITITPQGKIVSTKYQIIGSSVPDTIATAADIVAARVVQAEKEVSFSLPSTGEASGNDVKAQGTVVIYNTYSQAEQPLVATTRLATPDGKIFRLVSGVTVPGQRSVGGVLEPGAVEVSVIADQPGESYNIGPTEFTIPGFQGGPKYEKFTAKSTRAMGGGRSGGSGAAKVIAEVDISQAETKAKDEVKTLFEADLSTSLKEGERLIGESLEIVAIGSPSFPPVGSSAERFEFRGRYQIRGFVVSETSLKSLIEKKALEEERSDEAVSFKIVNATLSYGKPLALDFGTGRIELSVQAELTLRAQIDLDTLRGELAGQNEEGIRLLLERHPEIKNLRTELKTKRSIIPKNPDRIMILLDES